MLRLPSLRTGERAKHWAGFGALPDAGVCHAVEGIERKALGARRVVGTRRAPISPQRSFSLEQARGQQSSSRAKLRPATTNFSWVNAGFDMLQKHGSM